MNATKTRCRVPPLLIAASVALVILTARLAWVASQTESGWDTLGVHWRNATLGWFGAGHRPEERPEFWLAEAERILDENPESAELAMGAAWVLDALAADQARPRNPPVEKTDETACREASLRLARRATELDLENRDWWRMRALLIFDRSPFYGDLHPRIANWAATLAEASRHDPDNALYGYLAAIQHWQASGRREWTDRREQIEVLDPGGFHQGDEHFARGVAKPILAIGERSRPAIAAFLGRSSLPRHDQAAVAAWCILDVRSDRLVRELRRWQRARASQIKVQSHSEALRAWRQFLRIPEQVEAAGEPGALFASIQLDRWAALLDLRSLAEEHPGTINDNEFQRLTEEIAFGRRRVIAYINTVEIPTFSDLLPGLVATARLSAALPLLAGGVLGFLVGGWLSRSRTRPQLEISPFAFLCTWGIGFAIAAGIAAALAADPVQPRMYTLAGGVLDGENYWSRFAIRWLMLPGYLLGAGLSLLLLGLCHIVRASDNDPRACLRLCRSGAASFWGGLLTCLSRSALALGGCLLLMYLLAAPAAVRLAETTYQQTIAPIREPEAYWSSIERRVAEIEKDWR